MRVPGARGFDIDLKFGESYEHEVLRILLDGKKLEVKTQPNAGAYGPSGSLFVETHDHGRPSGLTTTDAEWWVFVYAQGRQMILIRTDVLRVLVEDRGRRSRGGDDNAMEGWVVSIPDMAKHFP